MAEKINQLKKWLRGEMTWSEEKLLRQEAEKDAFLGDAMEGYEQFISTDHTRKLASLNQHIRQKNDIRPNLFLIRTVAATCLLLLSVGLYWWTQNRLGSSNSTTLVEKSLTEFEEQGKKFDTTPEATTADIEAVTNPIGTIPVPQPSKQSKKADGKRQEKTEKESIFKTEETPINNTKTATIQNGTTETSSPPEMAAIEQNIDYQARSLPQREVLSDNEAGGDATSKAQEATTRGKRFSTAMRADASPTQRFQGFVQENLRYPLAAKQQGIKGIVRLQFSTNAKGDIENITVLDSLGYGCEAEAIRLLKNGPQWYLPSRLDTCEVRF